MRELRRAARGGGLVEARGAWGETGAVVVVVGGGGAYRYAPGREGGGWGGAGGPAGPNRESVTDILYL